MPRVEKEVPDVSGMAEQNAETLARAVGAKRGERASATPPAKPARAGADSAEEGTKVEGSEEIEGDARPVVVPEGGTDPREARAAASCVELEKSAVIVRGEGPTLGFLYAAEAFDQLASGDLLWLCAGAHTTSETTVLSGLEDIVIVGSDAVLVGQEETPALVIKGGRRITLRGLRVLFDTYLEEPGDALRITGVQGLLIESSVFKSEMGSGLALDKVAAAAVRSSRFVGSEIGASAVASEVIFVDNTFEQNWKNYGGDLTKETLGENNSLARRRRPRRTGRAPKLAEEDVVGVEAAFPEGRSFAVIRWKDKRTYAVLSTSVTPTSLKGEPGCTFPNEDDWVCTKPIPAKGVLPEDLTPGAFAKLQAITATGPCTLEVGEPVFLDTTGCEPHMTLAVPISGCGDFAPLVTGGEPHAELRWIKRTAAADDLKKTPPPGPSRRWLKQQLRTSILDLDALKKLALTGSSAIVEWSVDLPKERWVTRAAGIQLQVSECGSWEPGYVESSMTPVGGKSSRVKMPSVAVDETPWVGALEYRGRLAAFVIEGEAQTALLLREPNGKFSVTREANSSSDHDECRSSPGPLAFGSLCDP